MRISFRPCVFVLGLAASFAPVTCLGQTATVGNFVWMDGNRNGVQDAGEPGIAGVTVQLWNGALNDFLATTTTDANGAYALTAPTGMAVRVRALLPEVSLHFTGKDRGGDDLRDSDVDDVGALQGFTDSFTALISGSAIPSKDIGMVTAQPASLGNFVWEDFDRDGVQDPGEPGLGDVSVQLWNEAMNDFLDAATTNAQGGYSLSTPEPGNYRVRVLLPNGYVFSPKDQGADDLRDSDFNAATPAQFTDAIVVAPITSVIASIDAGIYGLTHFANGFEDP